MVVVEVLLSVLLLSSLDWARTRGHLNAYEKDAGWMIHSFDGPCLFVKLGQIYLDTVTVMPYCFRPDIPKAKETEEENICFGESISFQQLRSMNVSVSDLFSWNAAMQSIEAYSQFLANPRAIKEKSPYCKCSSPLQFGQHCQYELDQLNFSGSDDNAFISFLEYSATHRLKRTMEDMKIEYITCYIGIPCRHNALCLDWRQICNGMVDCDEGEDEPIELCLQMDLNSCDPEHEFRCHSGMCVPIDVWNDGETDCPDRTDERSYWRPPSDSQDACMAADDFLCEETSCRWKEYSCGDGGCLSYATAGVASMNAKNRCSNLRNLLLVKKLFSSTSTDVDRCWTSMICLVGFSHLYSDIACPEEQLISLIEEHCPDEFFFPANPVIYSFVYFLYVQTGRTDWSSYTGPDYICYKEERCKNLTATRATIMKNNLTCIAIDKNSFSWTNYYEYVLYLFSSCYSSLNSVKGNIDEKLLFQCQRSNTTISIHHVNDKRRDCYFGEDENSTIDFCSFGLEDTFVCLTNRKQCVRQLSLDDNENDCSDGSDEDHLHAYKACPGRTCVHRFQQSLQLEEIYVFGDLCDGMVNHYLFPEQSGETDETDCQHWPYRCYNSPFTRCDGFWHCPNGLDEYNCGQTSMKSQIEKAFRCAPNAHYCVQFTPNRMDIQLRCLPYNRSGDGIVDCIGATDERLVNPCTRNYPFDYKKRFLCMNSSVCIAATQVCDRNVDCPWEDDELVCPWLHQSNATKFYCQNAPSRLLERCDGIATNSAGCQHRENSWFCDLAPRRPQRITYHSSNLALYPNISLITQSKSSIIAEADRVALGRSMPVKHHQIWLCNHGYPVRSTNSSTQYLCLCPPMYYGEQCQYQSERLSVHLKLKQSYYFHSLLRRRSVQSHPRIHQSVSGPSAV